jgi:hypothetical protein
MVRTPFLDPQHDTIHLKAGGEVSDMSYPFSLSLSLLASES